MEANRVREYVDAKAREKTQGQNQTFRHIERQEQ